MIEKILPYEIPMVQTSLSHAHPLAIMQNNDAYKGWLFTNYMQLYTYYNRKNPLNDYKVDFFSCRGKYPDIPFFEYYKINKSMVNNLEIDIVKFTIDSINKNYYVECGIDEFYWPNKEKYQQRHYHHDNLIIGYNLHNNEFYYIGYNKNMIFGQYSVDFQSYKDSFDLNEESNLRLIRSDNREMFEPSSRYIFHDNINFDITEFSQYLSDYIHSKNSFISHKGSAHSVFGINVYHDIIEKVISCDETSKDMRIYRLLWEHKVVMSQRLSYLSKMNLIHNNDKLLGGFTNLEKEFFLLKNLAIKFLFTNNSDFLENIIKKLNELSYTDQELCHDLLLNLKF